MANIRTSHKSGFVVRSGVRRRESLWIAGVWTENDFALGFVALLTFLSAEALALRPFTIVRTRGLLYLGTDQVAGTENQAAIYGEIVVQDTAAAVGIGSVPTPLAEGGSDFHVYEPIASRVSLVTAASMFHDGVSKEIDSKAMRKVDLGQTLLSVVETAPTGASEGVNFRSFSRTLIKLH